MPAPSADLVRALRGSRLWRSASDEAVARLAERAAVRTAARGDVLATEGETAERLGVVLEGRVRVFHLGADGRTMTFEVLGAGETIAADASLAGARFSANVEAVTPAVVAWLPRDAVYALLEAEPAVARDVITDLASRVVEYTSVASTLALDVPARLARFLFNRALAGGTAVADGLLVDLGMPKAELAAALGTVPETLSRAFARLKEQDLVIVRGRAVTIRDVGALARMGAGYEEG